MSLNRRNNSKPRVLTKEDDRLLLTQLQEMEIQHDCKCKNCMMKELSILAYKIARKYKRNYPESRDRNKQAGESWVYRFVARYKNEISKFSSVCKKELTILTKEDERLLLTQLQEIETQHGCKCKNCTIKELPILAYKIARKYKRNNPESWDRNKQAGES